VTRRHASFGELLHCRDVAHRIPACVVHQFECAQVGYELKFFEMLAENLSPSMRFAGQKDRTQAGACLTYGLRFARFDRAAQGPLLAEPAIARVPSAFQRPLLWLVVRSHASAHVSLVACCAAVAFVQVGC
jgi:hypothetical protein